MNNLERISLIDAEKLDEQNYFQSLLQEAYLKKILSDSELENIQIQCVQLLSDITNQYTKGESSSVSIENAESLMHSVFYCLSMYLKSRANYDICIDDLKQKRIIDIYKIGNELVRKQFKKSKYLFENVRKNLIETDNIAYKDTIPNGLAIFFKSYDMDFATHETPCSIDYPLLLDILDMTGVEYMYSYLQTVYLENKFCNYFQPSNIENVLRGFDENYIDDLINIFERVLLNSLGCVLLNKNALDLDIETAELDKLKNLLSDNSINNKINEATQIIISELNITDNSLIKYISLSADNIAEKIKNAVEIDQIDSAFTVPKLKDNKPKLNYQDGTIMEDDDLRQLVEEIKNCDNAEDKIKLIKNRVESIVDLIDILDGGCLFDEDFNELYKSFGDMEIALLLRYASGDDLSFDLTTNENEWQSILKHYFESFNNKRKELIIQITKNMA